MITPLDSADYKKFENLQLLARQVVEGFLTGLHKSPFHGFSVEFAEHRIYNPGDSIRNIDWRLFARTEKLFLKKYTEETNLRCQVLIDNSSSMFFPAWDDKSGKSVSKYEFAIQAAASLIYVLKKQRDAAGVTLFNKQIDTFMPSRTSSTHMQEIFALLQNRLNRDTQNINLLSNPSAVLHEVADMIPKRSLVIIFSDMMENVSQPDSIFNALQHLRHNKHEVILFHTFDRRKELELEYDNRPYRFIDMETGREIRLNPAQIKEKYRQHMQRFFDDLRLKCMQYKIDFVTADINQGFQNILLSFFAKRSKLF